jgi:hypothetical protein
VHERYETREDKSEKDFSYGLRFASKMVLAPLLATSFESLVSNKAEGIRFYGPEKYFKLEGKGFGNVLHKITGPAVSVFFNLSYIQLSIYTTTTTFTETHFLNVILYCSCSNQHKL